ncbi:MAG TPA: heavy metal-binding domain-containing protein [Phenylobacterium sp.]
MTSRRTFIGLGVVAVCACAAGPVALAQAPAPPGTKYVCPPCGCSADGKEFDKPGDCPACGMPLIPKAPAAPKANDGGGASLVSSSPDRAATPSS